MELRSNHLFNPPPPPSFTLPRLFETQSSESPLPIVLSRNDSGVTFSYELITAAAVCTASPSSSNHISMSGFNNQALGCADSFVAHISGKETPYTRPPAL